MRFRIEQRFAHPLHQVEEAFLEPDLLQRMAELPQLGRPELLDQSREGNVVRRRVRQRFAGDLPSAVTAVVDPARLTWVDESEADLATHRSDHRVVPDHYGGRLRSTYVTELHDDGAGGTVRVTEGEVGVRFPLVGGRVERAIVSELRRYAELETELVETWLSERHS
ncbi:MAG TPA: DUF2505 family protein [Acidimicrobiales bacterium]|nr:DUF2505 family protein [Acidimicrobiales bacterium]